MNTYFQKTLDECSNKDLLEKFRCNIIVQVSEFKYTSKFKRNILKQYDDIEAEILKRMNK